MNKHFSLYLDLVRFLAAVLVVVSHFGQHGIVSASAQLFWPQLGRESVIVFFVLSGFVIAYTSVEKAATLHQYVVARCARIYSVVLPVLLATIVAALVTTFVFNQPVIGSYQFNKPYIYLPLHVLFAGELWNLSETPPWLAPYWSLGFEVWYYILFGVLFYARGKVRLLLAAVILLVMGHKLWLLLPVWMSGVVLYRYHARWQLGVTPARLGWAMTIMALVLYKASGADDALRALGHNIWPFPGLKLGNADRYLADYVVCAIVYLNFLCARHAQFAALELFARPIRAVATYTFTLYLIHAPVMGMWRAFYPHDSTLWTDTAALTLCIALACYLFGLVTERRREWIRQRFDRLLSLPGKR